MLRHNDYCNDHQPQTALVPVPWWWLSFVDETRPAGDRFVGACLVPARNHDEAIATARAWGCLPRRYTQVAMGWVKSTPPEQMPIGELLTDKTEVAVWANDIDVRAEQR